MSRFLRTERLSYSLRPRQTPIRSFIKLPFRYSSSGIIAIPFSFVCISSLLISFLWRRIFLRRVSIKSSLRECAYVDMWMPSVNASSLRIEMYEPLRFTWCARQDFTSGPLSMMPVSSLSIIS